MQFYDVLDQVVELLQRHGRVSYRALKRQFDLDEAFLDDVKVELIDIQQRAVDHEGTLLVWTGARTLPTPATPPAPADSSQVHVSRAETPPHLADKIRTARSTLEGERKQVTVFFADIKGSTELIEGFDPEEARKLLDPALQLMMEAVHRYEGTVNQVLGDGIWPASAKAGHDE